MSAVLRLAVAFLMALVGLGTGTGPTNAAFHSVAHHDTDDSAATSSTLTHAEAERGPPITCGTPVAADAPPPGWSACPRTVATYTYPGSGRHGKHPYWRAIGPERDLGGIIR